MFITLDKISDEPLRDLVSRYLIECKHSQNRRFIDNLILSAIGARICYSDQSPIDLIREDPRIYDPVERIKFLKRLRKAKHYSVFAHSPLFMEYLYTTNHPLPYKSWWYDINEGNYTRRYVCFNVRHLVESQHDNSPVFTLNDDSDVDLKMFLLTDDNIELVSSLSSVLEPNNPYLLVFYIDKKPWEWYSVVIHGVSSCMTHQLVRHTWLNFSQRSHRYTKVDYGDVVVPPSIKDTVFEISYQSIVSKCFDVYEDFIQRGIPKEDARYIIPSGRMYTIMASGPRFVWEDFINKRNHYRAQWEIRWLAERMNKILNLEK